MKHNILQPAVGNWYQDLQDGQLFEIVAIDDNDGSINVQYFDGEIEEFDKDTWHLLNIRIAAPPEDWSAPYEMDASDRHEMDGEVTVENWNDPLNKLDAADDLHIIDTLDE
jgi:hypothetical protein